MKFSLAPQNSKIFNSFLIIHFSLCRTPREAAAATGFLQQEFSILCALLRAVSNPPT